MQNNNLPKNNIHKSKPSSPSLIRSFLAAICVVFLSIIANLAIGIESLRVSMVDTFLGASNLLEGAKEFFSDNLPLGDPFIFSIILLLTAAFYLSGKGKKKYLFFYPPLSIIFSFVIFLFISTAGGPPEAILYSFMAFFTLVIYLFFSLVTSLFIYFRKELLLFIITGIIIVISLFWWVKLAEYSVRTTDPKICEIFSLRDGGRLRSICLTEIAERTNNIDICNKDCGNYKNCILSFAIRENNPDLCKKISTCLCPLGGSCRLSPHDTKLDQEDCLKSFAATTGNLELCETLTARTRDSCISSVAAKRDDPELCKKIEDDYLRGRCNDYFEY